MVVTKQHPIVTFSDQPGPDRGCQRFAQHLCIQCARERQRLALGMTPQQCHKAQGGACLIRQARQAHTHHRSQIGKHQMAARCLLRGFEQPLQALDHKQRAACAQVQQVMRELQRCGLRQHQAGIHHGPYLQGIQRSQLQLVKWDRRGASGSKKGAQAGVVSVAVVSRDQQQMLKVFTAQPLKKYEALRIQPVHVVKKHDHRTLGTGQCPQCPAKQSQEAALSLGGRRLVTLGQRPGYPFDFGHQARQKLPAPTQCGLEPHAAARHLLRLVAHHTGQQRSQYCRQRRIGHFLYAVFKLSAAKHQLSTR